MSKYIQDRLKLDNEFLELIDDKDKFSRSDFQGAVSVLVIKAMEKGKENISIDDWIDVGNDNDYY